MFIYIKNISLLNKNLKNSICPWEFKQKNTEKNHFVWKITLKLKDGIVRLNFAFLMKKHLSQNFIIKIDYFSICTTIYI